MSQNPNTPDESDSQHVEDLVFRCLEAEDFTAELLRQCADHPGVAERLRRVADRLHSEGMLEGEQLEITTHVAGFESSGPRVPKQLGDFKLIRRLGVGGMGIVYVAEERKLGRKVAVKIVRPEQLYFPGSRERFRREVEAIARLQHPGIVTIYSVGEADGIPFFSMDYVEGQSLAKVIANLRGRDPSRLRMVDVLEPIASRGDSEHESATPSSASSGTNDNWMLGSLKILRRVAEALVHAHEHGVLHRDVKPSNIILGKDGRPRLLDFGLARLEDSQQELTKPTSQLGSLPYMPPEVVGGRLVTPTPTLDVYSLGVMMYELLTLRSPFLCQQGEATRERILRGECPPLRELNPAVSWEVQTVCATAMELAPARRYQTMASFLQDIDNLLARRPILARPSGRLLRTCRWVQRHPTASVAIGMAALLLAVTIGFAVEQRDLAEQARETSYMLGLTAADAQLDESRTLEARRSLALCPEDMRGFEWHYLNLRSDCSDATYRGHTDGIIAIDFHPDGKTFITGSQDGTIRVWRSDRKESEVLVRFEDAEEGRTPIGNWVRALGFSVDGSYIFAGTSDHLVRRLNQDGTAALVIGEHSSDVTSLAVDPSGRFIASGSSKGEIKLYDATGVFVADLRSAMRVGNSPFAAERPVKGLVFSADGSRLFAGHMEEFLVFDTRQKRQVHALQHEQNNWVFLVIPLADGRHVVTGGNFGTLSKWDLETGQRTHVTERSFLKGIQAGVLDRRSGRLLVAGPKGPIGVCDSDELRLLYFLQGHEDSVYGMDISSDGETVVSCGKDRTARRWSVKSRSAMRVLGQHEDLVRTLEITPDGRHALTGGSDGNLRQWDIDSGAMVELYSTAEDKIQDTSLSPDGGRVIVVAARVHVVDLGETPTVRRLASVPPAMKSVAWFPDGRRAFCASRDGKVMIVDVEADEVLAENEDLADEGRDGYFGVVAICPWNGMPITGSSSGRLTVFDGRTLRQERQLDRMPAGIGAILFDTVSRIVVVGDYKGEIRFLDFASGRPVRPAVRWDGQVINDITISPDGRRIATASMGRTLQIWQYPEMRQLLLLRGHTRGVFAVRFAPDGRRLLSTSWDRTVRVWETERR